MIKAKTKAKTGNLNCNESRPCNNFGFLLLRRASDVEDMKAILFAIPAV